MTQKDIRRLFPCDNSMVVVIDDRADVWSWSPNLIKVHPCKYLDHVKQITKIIYLTFLKKFFFTDDFFVGIGDINDTYLPKVSFIIIYYQIIFTNFYLFMMLFLETSSTNFNSYGDCFRR